MMYLCSVVSELSNYDSCQSVHLHINAGVILPGDAIQANKCLVLGEIKGCDPRISG